MENLATAGFSGFKLSVVCTRHNIPQLDAFKAIADRYGAQLRLTRLRPSGRGADVWDELHPTAAQQRELYDWLLTHGEGVLTGDSFFHLAGYGEALPGLNLCGAGRVVCLIDPVGDVYACPFAIHDAFRAGNVRSASGFAGVWRESELFRSLREPQSGGACAACSAYDSCRGGCMAAKFFTGLPLDGPDPECVKGFGEIRLAAVEPGSAPRPSLDHSRSAATAGVRDALHAGRAVGTSSAVNAAAVHGGGSAGRAVGTTSAVNAAAVHGGGSAVRAGGPTSAVHAGAVRGGGSAVCAGGAVPGVGVPVTIGRRRPDRACDENPLAAMGR
jgi:radical SAM protein with 4Fe4S-binding SPASM domain